MCFFQASQEFNCPFTSKIPSKTSEKLCIKTLHFVNDRQPLSSNVNRYVRKQLAKDSSIRETLFKGKVQKCVGKSLEIVICVNFSQNSTLKQLDYELEISIGRQLIRPSTSSTITSQKSQAHNLIVHYAVIRKSISSLLYVCQFC